jgi:hypothetical protein
VIRRYVHLGINPRGGGRPGNWNRALEALLLQHGDWFRYANQNYVVFTDADLRYLSDRIRSLPGFQATYILLTELSAVDHLHCNGWMDPKFWQWLQGKRDLQF